MAKQRVRKPGFFQLKGVLPRSALPDVVEDSASRISAA